MVLLLIRIQLFALLQYDLDPDPGSHASVDPDPGQSLKDEFLT
jgi:hypothetical protein